MAPWSSPPPKPKPDEVTDSDFDDPFASKEEDPFANASFGDNTPDDPFNESTGEDTPVSSTPSKPNPLRPPGLPLPNPTPQKIPPKQAVELSYPVCGLVGVGNFLRGGQLGLGFGLVFGGFEAVQTGMWREPKLMVGHVAGKSIGNALSFGGFLGAFNGVKCSMAVARGGKQDLLNSGVAGALAGSIGSLRTRNPAMIGGSAALSGCLMMVIDGLQGGA